MTTLDPGPDRDAEAPDDVRFLNADGKQMVSAVRVRCNACRRRVGREMENARKGGMGLPRTGRSLGPCPHYTTVWAPGYGPDADPKPGSGWETRPEGAV